MLTDSVFDVHCKLIVSQHPAAFAYNEDGADHGHQLYAYFALSM